MIHAATKQLGLTQTRLLVELCVTFYRVNVHAQLSMADVLSIITFELLLGCHAVLESPRYQLPTRVDDLVAE